MRLNFRNKDSVRHIEILKENFDDGSFQIIKDHVTQKRSDRFLEVVELTGLEPVTFCLQSRCSPN